MKLISISGGATEIAALLGAYLGVRKNGFIPDTYAGISAGAILSFVLAAGKTDKAKQLALTFTLDTIFDKKPVNAKGKLKLDALARLTFGKKGLGSYDNLRKTLKAIVSENDFLTMSKDVYVGVVNYTTEKSEIIKLSDYNYETAIEFVVASASIPIFVPPVRINGSDYFDGGIRDHNIANKLLEFKEFSELVSIYVRDLPKNESVEDLSDIIQKTIAIRSNEISVSDEKIERELCQEQGIKYNCIKIEGTMLSFFDCNPKRLKEAYLKGLDAGAKYK